MAFNSSNDSNPFSLLSRTQSVPSTFAQNVAVNAQAQTGASPEIIVGNDLQDQETEKLGLVALAGETLVKIIPDGYTENSLPIPSAQLFAIAQRRGIFAAVGPSGLFMSPTLALRQSFKSESKGQKSVPFQSQLVIPMQQQISQVAFTADEKYLLLGATVGGIAGYLVDELMSSGSNTKATFELGTPPIRELKPIPTADKPELVCILTGGEWGQAADVGMLNVETRSIQTGLKSGVTTISWSPKGKQIVCGGVGGGLCWITPDGQTKAEVGSMPAVRNCFISSLLWIETHIFYIVYTPMPGTEEMDSETVHYILNRTAQGQHTFNKITDTAPPFGMSSRPTVYSFVHLKTWSPALKDMLLLTNTSSADVGVVVRWDNGNFMSTPIALDSRRGSLPMDEGMMDTTPIGLALDLSVTPDEKIRNPVPGSDLEESTTASPALYILNNEGKVSAYWIVYTDAVLSKSDSTAYPGLLAYGGARQDAPITPAKQTPGTFTTPAAPPNAFSSTTPAATPAFGASTFGQPSSRAGAFGGKALSFGSPQNPAFGSTSTPQGAFGSMNQQNSMTPAFGSSSALGRPAFGSTTGLGSGGPAFGAPSNLGNTPSTPFGSTTQTAGSAFGSTSALGGNRPAFGTSTNLGAGHSPFGTPSALGSGGGGAFGSGSAFGKPSPLGGSAFGQTTSLGAGAFGQPSPLGKTETNANSAFGSSTTTTTPSSGGFGRFASGGGFTAALGGETTQSPANPFGSGGSTFGSSNKEPDAFSGLAKPTSSGFGAPDVKSAFQMRSAFQESAVPGEEEKSGLPFGSAAGGGNTGGAFGSFGSGLGGALGSGGSGSGRAAPAVTPDAIKEEEMGDESEEEDVKERHGPTGGNMFALGNATNTPKAEPAKSAFGTGLFGSALSQEQTTPSKGAFGSGIFGQALQQNQEKKAEPAFGTPEAGKLFGSSGGAFGQKLDLGAPGVFGTPLKKEEPTTKAEEKATGKVDDAAAKALPEDSDLEDDAPETTANDDAPMPPDFTTDRSAKSGWGAGKMALPPGAEKDETKKVVERKEEKPETKIKQEEVEAEAPLPPDFTTDKTAKGGWGAAKMPLPGDKPEGTPKAEPKSLSGNVSTPTPKTGEPKKSLFDTSSTPKPSSGLFSNVTPSATNTPPSAGRKSMSGSGMARPAGRDRASATKAKKVSPHEVKVPPTSTAPPGFSIFGAGGYDAVKAKETPVASGGSIFSSVSANKGMNLFADVKNKVEAYQPGDTDEEDEEDDEDDDEEDEGDEDGEGETEDLDDGEEGEDEEAEWVDGEEEGDYGDESPVDVKQTQSMLDLRPDTAPFSFAQQDQGQGQKQSSGLFARIADATSSSMLQPQQQQQPSISAPKPIPAQPRPPTAQQLADQEATKQRQLQVAKQKAAQDKVAEERRKYEDMMRQEQANAQKEEEYRESLQRPAEASGDELVEYMAYVEGGPYTAFTGLQGIMEYIVISTSRGVNTYAANLRILEAYIRYQRIHEKTKTTEEVSSPASWRLSNVKDMTTAITQAIRELKAFTTQYTNDGIQDDTLDTVGKIDALFTRSREIPNVLVLQSHPRFLEEYKLRPLNPSQRLQRANLRRKIPELRVILNTTEKEFTAFQARIAAVNKRWKSNLGGVKPPTHEAVRGTILRLTRTAKEKGEKIDLLEDRLRKIRLRSTSPSVSRGTTPAIGLSRQGSAVPGGGVSSSSSALMRGKSSLSASAVGVEFLEPTPDSFEYYAQGTATIKEEPESDDDNAALYRVPLVSSYSPVHARNRSFGGGRSGVFGGGTSSIGGGESSLPTTPAGRKVKEIEERDLMEELGQGDAGRVRRQRWSSMEEYRDEKEYRRLAGRRMREAMKGAGVKITVAGGGR